MSTTTTNLESTFQNLMTLENQIRDLKETYDEELSTICEALIKDFPEMIEDAYPYGHDLIGLVNPVLHTKLKSLSSLNHTQRITYINELYDEHWSDKHTTVIY